jgi:hypothetical protein
MSTYTPIATQTLSANTASVTFSSIPQGYTDLVLVIQGTHTSTGNNWIGLQYNGDTGTTYSSTVVRGDGGSVSSSRNTSDNYAGRTIITSAQQSNAIYQIQNYSNSTTYKTCLARSNGDEVDMSVGLWRNTAAIATVTIVNIGTTFSSGTTFSIYGIQVGASTQKAQGGNIVTSDGTYVYHTFTSSGSFIPSQALTVDYLVVAGGGGGASGLGGGGGAGGYRTSIGGTALSLTAISYPVVIGAGGVSTTDVSVLPSKGSDSVFSTITSTGGGRGVGQSAVNGGGGAGGAGGSGGGGSRNNNTAGAGNTPSTSPSQGNNGGTGNDDMNGLGGGGGGGAGAAGSNGSSSGGGNGGAGASNNITGTSITYAGGGGGGAYIGTAGTGGAGGGGNGSVGSTNTTTSGGTNTGGGGGGGGDNSGGAAKNGGAGGSGIVVIRYAI